VTDAEKSAYVCIAAGVIWLLVAIVGRWMANRPTSSEEVDQYLKGDDE
jgi:hypothetical protein